MCFIIDSKIKRITMRLQFLPFKKLKSEFEKKQFLPLNIKKIDKKQETLQTLNLKNSQQQFINSQIIKKPKPNPAHPMGNTSQSSLNQTNILQKYSFIKQLTQGKNLYKNPQLNNKQFITIERTFATHQMLLEYEKRISGLLKLSHPYFLNETEHAIITNSNICSVQHKVIHFFQSQTHTLQQQLQTRKTHQRHFQQKEVWSILCSCVLAMSYLTKNNVQYYVLHPKDVIIDKFGMIKIVSPLLSQTNSGFQEMVNQRFYYSPQHLKAFKLGSFQAVANKSSIFTLGLTLLHILSLEPMNQLFNYQECSINMDLLNQLVGKISQLEIQEIIKKMVKLHTYDRITFTQLQEMLYNVLEEGQQVQQTVYTHGQSRRKLNYGQIHGNSQIQRLEESIYKVNKTQHEEFPEETKKIISNNKSLDCLLPDSQDLPQSDNCVQSLIDPQNVDQQDAVDLSHNNSQSQELQSYRNTQFQNTKSINQFTSVNTQNIHSNNNSHSRTNNYQELKTKSFIPAQPFNFTQTQTNVLKQRSQSTLTNIPSTSIQNQKQNISSLNSSFTSSVKHKQMNSQAYEQNKPYHIRQQLSRGVYEGYKLNKMRHGYGVFYYAQGGKYVGEWVRNKMQGRGALYYANGQIAYEGEWKNDKLNGYGILYNQTPSYFANTIDYKSLHLVNDDYRWVKYEGNFVDDQKNGQGTLFFANGEYYRGTFQKDLPHGKGIFKALNGGLIKGGWILGIMQGSQQ